MPPLSNNELIAAIGAAAAFYLSHAYDIAYFHRSIAMNLSMHLRPTKQLHPQQAAHRFLRWFILSDNIVSSRDLDFNWHLSNSRYARHADFARFKLIMATGFLQAIYALSSNLVVSGMSQKFRRELSAGQVYQIWARFVGWDDRHFYVEHVFCYHEDDDAVDWSSDDDRSSDRIPKTMVFDGTDERVKEVVDLREKEFRNQPNTVVANVMTLRLTTTRNQQGNIVTPAQVLHQMELLGDIFPDIALPPIDVQQWTDSLEESSNRLTRTTARPTPVVARSRL